MFCVAQDETRNKNGVERRRNEGLLVGSDSMDDEFSDWFEFDPVDSQGNKWFGSNDEFKKKKISVWLFGKSEVLK